MWDDNSYAKDGQPCKAVDGKGDARMKATSGGPRGNAGRYVVAVDKTQVLAALRAVSSPRGVQLADANVLSEIMASDGKVFFSINVDANEARAWEDVRAKAEAAVRAIPGVTTAMVALTAERKPGAAAASAPHQHSHGVRPVAQHRPQGAPADSPMGKQAAIPGIGAIIAVASGKGGVGKSTTALNLALALRDLGLRVGLLDADIYGPSVPRLTGVREKPTLNDARKMIPIVRFGLPLMSIGFLVEEETAMVWRGPMVMSAIRQMLWDVAWGELDVLVVDMPPGTGDAQLTLAQQVPLRGVVIVSTPQDLALIDARRGIAMFDKVSVPTLGIIENMSYFQCPECGTRSDIFGHGGARHEAERLKVPFLGEIPLHLSIRTSSDAGTPVVDSEPDGPHAAIYRAIGAEIKKQLAGAAATV
ncbi:MAG: Scaffold protein for [4Fe-4S] cluster assembly ApbC, MRP-like [Afipia sp.]|jgi:ATP-binding protein involved in chromosome partitioning|nr:MAG: Scaffold protein for [4Fe-4S] cluster assembly ApbC, MRP-like [Afipia sp.]